MGTTSNLLLSSLLFWLLITQSLSISADNVCTFHVGGRLFSLLYLDQEGGYEVAISEWNTLVFNFCSPLIPQSCSKAATSPAYSFFMTKFSNESSPITNKNMSQSEADNSTDENETQTNQAVLNFEQELQTESFSECTRYSSNSYAYLFRPSYEKVDKLGTLKLILYTEKDKEINVGGKARYTQFLIQCSDYEELEIESYSVDDEKITIKGNSLSACPVFNVSNIWQVLNDNSLIFGVILLVLGLYMLFYGRVTIQVTIFVAAFFISFAVIGSIFTLFVSPHSSTFVMYFSFLVLLTMSTLMAYGITRLVNVSIFFVGAFLGFIVGMLVNSVFSKVFDIYSVWSLVVFEIMFTIPFGVLTFKYRDEILIASSSLTGAYMVVRPISWIFGGFPNEFLMYQMIQSNELSSLPWSFFGYLILIVALAIIGAMYQLLKLYRQNPEQQVQVNAVQGALEQPIDQIKQRVDQLIQRFKSDDRDSNGQYKKMRQMKGQTSKSKLRDQLKEQGDF